MTPPDPVLPVSPVATRATPDAAGHAGPPAVSPAALLADQVDALQATLPASGLGNALIAAVLAATLAGHVPTAALAAWCAVLAAHCAYTGWVWWQVRGRPASERSAPRRARAATVGAGALGLLWGAAALLLWPDDGPRAFLLLFLLAGVASGGLHSLAALLPAFRAFFWPCMAGVVVASLAAGGVYHAVAAIAVIYTVVTERYARSLNAALVGSFRRRHEVQALAADLQRQRARAEAASQAKSRLLAMASHDLRQPVHALGMCLGPLRAADLPPAQAGWVRIAQRAAASLEAQFDALMDLSRLDAGTLAARPRPLVLRPWLQRLCDEQRAAGEVRGLSLGLRVSARLPDGVAVQTDPLLLERIVRNLLTNAVRYTDRGGVLMTLRPRADGLVELAVTDTGIGIDAQVQARVFEPFVQLAPGLRRRDGGLGLGLAIVQGLAEVLGHPLAMRSRLGRGTRFTVGLPRLPVVVRHAAAHAPPTLHGRRVALLEVDGARRAATCARLQAAGAQVVDAGDSRELARRLATAAAAPDLLVCDRRLAPDDPARDGAGAVDRLRDEFNEDIPAVLLADGDGTPPAAGAEPAGVPVLAKPVAVEALARAAAAPHGA